MSISKIKVNNQEHEIDAVKVNGHSVNADVPANAKFTDTTYTAGNGIDIRNNTITNFGVTSVVSAGTPGQINVWKGTTVMGGTGTASETIIVAEEATSSKAGLMSAADKENLDLITNSFNSDDADTTISTVKEVLKAFENAPEGTNITNALAGKVDKVSGKGLSTNDYTTTEKNKLSGIAENATAVSSSSTNGNIKINGTETMVYTHPASHPATMITGLATVATSGSYNDLTDKPTAATTIKDGLMSSTDKKKIDSVSCTSSSLGAMTGKTKADLRAALDTWLTNNSDIANASAVFTAAPSWVDIWNSSDATLTMSAGQNWLVTNIGKVSSKEYTQLRISSYSDKAVYYVHKSGGTWGNVHQASFDIKQSDLDKKVEKLNTNKGLSSAGWYRIAEITAGHSFACQLDIESRNVNDPTVSTTIQINKYNGSKPSITQLNHCGNASLITGVRTLCKSTSTWYIEIYYAGTKSNTVLCNFSNISGLTGPAIVDSLNLVNFTAGAIPDGYTATEFTISTSPIKASKIEASNIEATTSVAAPKLEASASTEARIAVKHKSGDLYLWGNSSTGTRGLYDSVNKYIIQIPDGASNPTFYGNLKGNADTATKATQDGNGNVIASTYATKEEIKNIPSTNLEYSEITNGSTALTSAGEYSFRSTIIDDSFGGDEIRIRGKEEDIRSPLSGVVTTTVNPFFSFATRNGSGSSATFSQAISADGGISMSTPIGSYWDTHWGWYNQKIKLPDLQFSLTLPSSSMSALYNNGVGFYLFTRLSHPYPAKNIELGSGSGAGFTSFGKSTLRDKINNQNQNLIVFMFVADTTNTSKPWKLCVASMHESGGGYWDTLSYQNFTGGKHNISFDDEAKVYVDGEKITWTADQIDWPYIAGSLVVDYSTRAYLGFLVSNYGGTSFTLTVNEITNKPGAILGNGDYPANTFAGGLQTTGIQTYKSLSTPLTFSMGTIPYTNHTLMDDPATMPQIVGPAVYLTDASQTASYVELYMSPDDLNTFWGDTLGFGANACIIKHSDSQWYLHTRKLDGTPISFALIDRFPSPSLQPPIPTQFTDYIATKTPAFVYEYVNTNSNKVGGTVENYKEVTVSKNIIWNGNAAEHLFCEYDSFDGKEHKTSISIAENGTISWTNSYENGLDGVQKLEVNA